ncbi:glycyl-radical enzyme activating protein [candidate division KSB3 bacterium]|uniref:Glycyl-radical enzyme activating protein n=1 Tax=candidate division KSB3 bacterium TaxID=2044937 RepID=A0A9D5JSZ2_9BACT|nr:glycyl-radical enzyme activating protein [candidate division KSB3 bacterium]MBD3323545.1 glycyl-radical enzyme activating protein [candidate division KSB3 bacterium]
MQPDSPTGVVFNIQHYAVHDGPGIRVTVFLKGCPLRCWWCHNPESQRQEPETLMPNIAQDMATSEAEPRVIGQAMTVADVMQEIEKDVIFFDESGGGVTFSGGEPLMQPEFLRCLLERCHDQDLHTALDTSGYAPPAIVDSLLEHVDLVLYDLKLVDDTLHQRYTGVSNRLILDNLRRISAQGKPLWIRFPVIPTITDREENIIDILSVVTNLSNVRQINLLPYHTIANGKYQRLHGHNPLKGVATPSEEVMACLQHRFEQKGLTTIIGG